MIGIQTLLDLEVALPPIELQKKVCQIAAFGEEEQRLRAIIADKRRKLLASTLTTIVMGGETH
jgi:restriction endonuclease S subunit